MNLYEGVYLGDDHPDEGVCEKSSVGDSCSKAIRSSFQKVWAAYETGRKKS